MIFIIRCNIEKVKKSNFQSSFFDPFYFQNFRLKNVKIHLKKKCRWYAEFWHTSKHILISFNFGKSFNFLVFNKNIYMGIFHLLSFNSKFCKLYNKIHVFWWFSFSMLCDRISKLTEISEATINHLWLG